MTKILGGKTAVVFGVANKRSIAWAITERLAEAGAKVALSYQSQRLEQNVLELASMIDEDPWVAPCDVTSDDQIRSFFHYLRSKTSRIDILLHSIAYAPREALDGSFLDTTRDAFQVAMDVSVYSLVAIAREAAPMFVEGGSIITMSFYGAQKVFPHYNVMGVAKAALEATVRYLAYDLGPKRVRVNAISAGPVNTLAARGISGFTEMLNRYAELAPMGRSCNQDEIAQTALFLASGGASAITGQTIFVDGGYEIMGMR
ncbi:MAG: enoyl-ACP reductase [Candidatus Sumerlaeaceae bacterium]|nr:enoyl-ACP reductase [Candidatus Sumerlaeaceae bacterium]